MNFPPVPAHYRYPNRDHYPELKEYSRDQIYEDGLGGGRLYLAAKMTRTMHLKPGDIVLDLGCGQGTTSIFLAKHFGVRVVALDWWTSATFLNEKFSARGYRDRIIPLNMDIAGRLPFAENYFDAIFCMNAFNFFGGSVEFLQHLLKHLKPGGKICIGMETLSNEMTPEERQHPPDVYNYLLPDGVTNTWEADFSKMHSPPWWENLFRDSGLVEILDCRELDDAVILYEDLVRYQIEHQIEPEDVDISIKQLEFGENNRPYKTLFTLTARKL